MPLIAGCAQLSEREGRPAPERLLREVCRGALADTGDPDGLREALGGVTVIEAGSWQVPDPARFVAEDLGLAGIETARVLTAGTAPIAALADACERIASGAVRAVLIAGVECFDTLLRAMKEGRDPGFVSQPEGTTPSRTIGEEFEPSHPVEQAAGLIAPVAYYPLFESALRADCGRSPDEHQSRLGELWERFCRVAVDNPHAWSREPRTAAEIAQPGPGNRLVSIPYTKLMNSNIQTNQAAALLVCSAGLVAEAGLDPARAARVLATASANDHLVVGSRRELHRSPALAACGRAVLDHCGLEQAAIEHLDLYSCFPSAVQVAARELGLDPLDPGRPPTATGGLSFAGGPGSNYVTHSLATLCEGLRERGGRALATGVGWYLTKHAVAVLEAGAGEGGDGYAHLNPQRESDAAPTVELSSPPESGSASVEAYTGLYDREGQLELGIAALSREDGRRTFAKADGEATLAMLAAEDALGARAHFAPGGRFELDPDPG